MKINRVLCCVFFILSFSLFAEEAKTISVSNVEIKGDNAQSNSWVSSLKEKIVSAILNNSDGKILIVDSEKIDEIISKQKITESGLYDEATMTEIGQLVAAQYILFSSVMVTDQGFFVDCHITDISTNTTIASSSENYKNSEEFSSFAANIIVSKFLPVLGVNLSSYKKAVLGTRKKVSDMSLVEAESIAQNLTESIQSIQNQLDSAEMTDIMSETRRVQLELEQKQLEIQQKEAQARVERLMEDERRQIEENKLMATRSEEMQKRIQANSVLFDEKANEIKEKLENEISIDGKLLVVEQKKQALYDLRKSVVDRIEAFEAIQDSDCKAEIDEINNTPLSKTETDANGKITSQTKKIRKERINKVNEKFNLLKTSYRKEQELLSTSADESIRQDILTDIDALSQPQRLSSIMSPNLLRFGNYDGAKEGWIADFSLMILGEVIMDKKLVIPYKQITGKEPVYTSTDYDDTVNEYDSYFNMNIPVVYAEIEYHIILHPNARPSNYRVFIDKFYLYDMRTQELIFEESAKSDKHTLVLEPSVDVVLKDGFNPYEFSKKINKTKEASMDFLTSNQFSLGINIMTTELAGFGASLGLNIKKEDFVFGPELIFDLCSYTENDTELSGCVFDVGGFFRYPIINDIGLCLQTGVQFQPVEPNITGYVIASGYYSYLEKMSFLLGIRYTLLDSFGLELKVDYLLN